MEECMKLDQETRNHVAEKILSLCLVEVFQFRFMQTDPNWANFMYNPVTREVIILILTLWHSHIFLFPLFIFLLQVILIDFGASREYSKEFVDNYIRVIEGAAKGDRQQVLEYSQVLGFLTGYESKV